MALSGNLTTRLIAMLREWESRRNLGAPPPAAFAVPFPVQPKFGKVDDNPWTTGTATVSIWEWSGSAWADSTENETVSMPPWIATWSVATGTWVRLDYDYQSEKWLATPMISQAVVTDQRIDTSSKKLQKKTRTEVGAFVTAESAWTDVYTFVAVTPLTYFDVDGANKKLRDKTTQFWAVEVQAEGAITDVHTGTVCP